MFEIICIDGVTVGPSEAEYHKSLADPEDGISAGGGGRGVGTPYCYFIYYIFIVVVVVKIR